MDQSDQLAPSVASADLAALKGALAAEGPTAKLIALGRQRVIDLIGAHALPYVSDEELAEIAKINLERLSFEGVARVHTQMRSHSSARSFRPH